MSMHPSYRSFDDLDPNAGMNVETVTKSEIEAGNQTYSIFKIESGMVDESVMREKLAYAVQLGYVEGIIETWIYFEPTVAKKTGRMRTALRGILVQGLVTDLHTSVSALGDTVAEFDMTRLITRVSAVVQYVIYHYLQMQARGTQYANPTTPNTLPISDITFISYAVPRVLRQTLLGLAGLGFQLV